MTDNLKFNITLYAGHEFVQIQKALIEIIEANSVLGRMLIIINEEIPSLLLNIKATLWYYNGHSYPHLNSTDSLADAAKIVVSNNVEYAINKNFQSIVCLHMQLVKSTIIQLNGHTEHIFILDNNQEIHKLSEELLKNNIVFNTYNRNIIDNIEESTDKLQNNTNEISYGNYLKDNDENSKNISDNISKINKNSYKMNRYEQDQDNRYDKAIVILKPSVMRRRLEFVVLLKLADLGVYTAKFYRRKLSKDFWFQFYDNISHQSFYDSYCEYMSSDYVGIVTVMGRDCINKLRSCIGPTNPLDCKSYHLRYQFGLDINDNGIHASDSQDNYHKENTLLLNIKGGL